MAMLKREYGGIQPCWKVGLFRIRLPFIHFKISPPEVVTGLMNACTSYGALAVLITTLGLDPAAAWALVVFETMMYTLNWLLGEPSHLRLDHPGNGNYRRVLGIARPRCCSIADANSYPA